MPAAINWNFYDALGRIVRPLAARGMTVREIAAELNARELPTISGKRWTEAGLSWVMLQRLRVSTASMTRSLPSRTRRKA